MRMNVGDEDGVRMRRVCRMEWDECAGWMWGWVRMIVPDGCAG